MGHALLPARRFTSRTIGDEHEIITFSWFGPTGGGTSTAHLRGRSVPKGTPVEPPTALPAPMADEGSFSAHVPHHDTGE